MGTKADRSALPGGAALRTPPRQVAERFHQVCLIEDLRTLARGLRDGLFGDTDQIGFGPAARLPGLLSV